MLPSSHRHGRARCAPWIELKVASALMFDVHVVNATVISIDRARCEQSETSRSFLAADEVLQSATAFKLPFNTP